MLSISFYLRTPKAENTSKVYISLSDKTTRERFPSDLVFLTQYCNDRTTSRKSLVKKNSPFTITYNKQLSDLKHSLYLMQSELMQAGKPHGALDVKEAYLAAIGKAKHNKDLTFFTLFDDYLFQNKNRWANGYYKVQRSVKSMLENYAQERGIKLSLQSFSLALIDDFAEFMICRGSNNSNTNKYVKYIKAFLRFANDAGHYPDVDRLKKWKSLKELEPFKIALKQEEVEAIADYDFRENIKCDRARDLLLLEILTGQRYSDMDKVLDRNQHDDQFIRIYQDKTGVLLLIPKYGKLSRYMNVLFEKYPDGFPIISSQKFNEHMKEAAKIISETVPSLAKRHAWEVQIGSNRVQCSEFRYNMVTSHVGRRTFCTLSVKQGIDLKTIMKVTGHKKIEQLMDYIRVDDDDLLKIFQDKF